MSTRDEQAGRYWLTTKGWTAALCVSQPAPTTPTSEPTEGNPRD